VARDVGDIRCHDFDPQRPGRRLERVPIRRGVELVTVLRAGQELGPLRYRVGKYPLACGDSRQQKGLELADSLSQR
jgi:hypothetical protein